MFYPNVSLSPALPGPSCLNQCDTFVRDRLMKPLICSSQDNRTRQAGTFFSKGDWPRQGE